MIKITLPEQDYTKRLREAIIECLKAEYVLRYNEEIARLPDTPYNRSRIPYLTKQILYEAEYITRNLSDINP